MSELKTKPTDQLVTDFLNGVEPEQKRKDSFQLLEMMQRITGCKPKMWGSSIVGFGAYHYKYASGREGDWFQTGFSPRKQNLSIYLMSCENDKNLAKYFSKLGKHKSGKSCLYVNKLADINLDVLEQIIIESTKSINRAHGQA
jgi:hypothetical protein